MLLFLLKGFGKFGWNWWIGSALWGGRVLLYFLGNPGLFLLIMVFLFGARIEFRWTFLPCRCWWTVYWFIISYLVVFFGLFFAPTLGSLIKRGWLSRGTFGLFLTFLFSRFCPGIIWHSSLMIYIVLLGRKIFYRLLSSSF